MKERTPKKLKVDLIKDEGNKDKQQPIKEIISPNIDQIVEENKNEEQINQTDNINFNGFDQLLSLIENEVTLNNSEEVEEEEEYNLSESEAILFSLKNNYVYNPLLLPVNNNNKNNYNNNNNNNINEPNEEEEDDDYDEEIIRNKIKERNYKLSTFLQKANDELEKNIANENFEKKLLSLESEVDELREKIILKDNEILDLNRMLNARNKFLNSIPKELLLDWIVTNKIVLANPHPLTNNSNITTAPTTTTTNVNYNNYPNLNTNNLNRNSNNKQ